MGPTISITADKVVTKKGEAVSKEVADVLSKLNIMPMKIGMKIIGVLDRTEGQYYTSSVLDVDEEELFNKFVLAYQQAFNLAVNAEYYCDASIEAIIMKAQREAKAVKEATDKASAEPAAQ
jgi:large subunit ribosomal protein L10